MESMEPLYLGGLLLGGLGLLLGNVLLLAIGVAALAYWVLGDKAIVLAETPELAPTPAPAPAPTPAPAPAQRVSAPVDDRRPRVVEPLSVPNSFVHIPLYQETFPYEKQQLDVAFAELADRSAVDPALQHSDKRVEFVQFLNEGKGPCRKDHWRVQAAGLPPPTRVDSTDEGGGSTIS